MGFRSVRGLHDLWSTTRGAPGEGATAVALRPLLDTLGLGVEQVIAFVGQERPGWEEFLHWAETTAGAVNGAAIDRYHAWCDGREPPPAERARQAAIMTTEPVFSAGEMAAWERDGVIVVRHAIDAAAAAAIEAHLWTARRATPDDPATWYRHRDRGIMVSVFQHPAMEVPRRSPRVQRAFAQLYGHADLIGSVDRLSFNPPVTADYPFQGPHLHWDASLTMPIPFETQGILYLTDTAAHQGAFRVVPGFHHRLADGWLDTLGSNDPRMIDLSGEAVPIAAGAGDLVIWRQDLPHGASPNTSDRPRMAQYVNMYPMRWPEARAWQ